MDDIVRFNLIAGWLGLLGGVISGALIGLFFHRDDWMGGYGSYRRRLVRLGHISFFGLGMVNFVFAFTARDVPFSGWVLQVASIGFIVGLVTMPACCFLSAWRKPFRSLFPIPVASVAAGILAVLAGLTMA